MAGHYLRQRAASADAAWSAGLFALVLVPISVLFYRFSLLDLDTLSFALALAGALALIGLLTALLAIAIVWHRGAMGGGRAVAALALGCLAALPFVTLGALFARYPSGNAAETIGLASGAVLATAAETTPADGGDVLVGRDFQATATVVFGAVRTAMAASGIEIAEVETSATPRPAPGDLGVTGTVSAPIPTPRSTIDPAQPVDRFAGLDADEFTISGTAYMPILALPSDVTIRVAEDGNTTYVDMRSQSRALERDLGQNRRIVQRFLERLEAEMNVLEGVTPEG